MNQLVKRVWAVLALTVILYPSFAQDKLVDAEKAEAYTKAITQRADKIVSAIALDSKGKSKKVRDIIVKQYRDLNDIHSARDLQVKALKSQYASSKASADSAIKLAEQQTSDKLAVLHASYLKSLSKKLSDKQIEMVKDGMTYGVLPITYRGYLQMLPNLTEDQKKQILSWLTEARELAMDAESSEKKHGWFGKYKGRINNYLSAAGIDMKQASIDWQNRIKAEEAAKKSQMQ